MEFIGETLNQIIGHPKGHHVYRGQKKRIGEELMVAGINHLPTFDRPVEIWWQPRVPGMKSSGKVSKQYDSLNFSVTYKIIEDWLVKCGVLRDDDAGSVYANHCLAAKVGKLGIEVRIVAVANAVPFGVQPVLDLSEVPAF